MIATLALLLLQDQDLFPLRDGTEWEFRVTASGMGEEQEVELTMRVERTDDAGVFAVQGSYLGIWGIEGLMIVMAPEEEEGVIRDLVERADEGVRIVGAEMPDRAVEFPEPWVWLSPNVEEGHAWEGTTELDQQVIRYEFSYGPVEEVAAPAGTFQARRLNFRLGEADSGDEDEHIEGAMWFVPGRGPVRFRWTLNEGPGGGVTVDGLLSRYVTPDEEG